MDLIKEHWNKAVGFGFVILGIFIKNESGGGFMNPAVFIPMLIGLVIFRGVWKNK